MKKVLLFTISIGFASAYYGQYCSNGGPSSTFDSNVESVFISGENGHGMGDLYQAFLGPFSLWMDTAAETKQPCAANAEGRVSNAGVSVGKSNTERDVDEGCLLYTSPSPRD